MKEAFSENNDDNIKHPTGSGRGCSFQWRQERVRRRRENFWNTASGRSWGVTVLSCPPGAPQPELLDLYTVNLHRIEKDVQRCDRNYWYFTPTNLEKLRNIMCRWLGRGWGGMDTRGLVGTAEVGATGSPAGTTASAADTMPTLNLIPAHPDKNITIIVTVIVESIY